MSLSKLYIIRYYLATVLSGLCYAIVLKTFGNFFNEFWCCIDSWYAFVIGLLLAMAVRPLFFMVQINQFWAGALALYCLFVLSPSSNWLMARLAADSGLMLFPPQFSPSISSLILANTALAISMTVLALGQKKPSSPFPTANLIIKGVRLTLLLIAIEVLLHSADYIIQRQIFGVPVIVPNILLEISFTWQNSASIVAVAGLAMLFALRLVFTSYALILVSTALKPFGHKSTIILLAMLFVIGEFAPLIAEQPFTNRQWLISYLTIGLLRSLAYALAALYYQDK